MLTLLAVAVLFQCQTNAAQVYLAGDFNDWARNANGRITDPQFAMTQTNGVWKKRVELEPGTYRFKFNVNGEPDGWFAPEAQRDADGNAIFRVHPDGRIEICRRISPRQTKQGVLFQLCAPEAHIVYLAGKFNDWGKNRDGLVFDPHVAMTHSNGIWVATIPLPPGRHEYQFVIDGDRWTAKEIFEVR